MLEDKLQQKFLYTVVIKVQDLSLYFICMFLSVASVQNFTYLQRMCCKRMTFCMYCLSTSIYRRVTWRDGYGGGPLCDDQHQQYDLHTQTTGEGHIYHLHSRPQEWTLPHTHAGTHKQVQSTSKVGESAGAITLGSTNQLHLTCRHRSTQTV